jgi:hypothetical protein
VLNFEKFAYEDWQGWLSGADNAAKRVVPSFNGVVRARDSAYQPLIEVPHIMGIYRPRNSSSILCSNVSTFIVRYHALKAK